MSFFKWNTVQPNNQQQQLPNMVETAFLNLISPDLFNLFQEMLQRYTVRATIATGTSIAVIFAALTIGVAFIVLAC